MVKLSTGEVFHAQSEVTLPVFRVKDDISPDGQIELDAIGEGHERWVVEVKWRNKRTGSKELEKLHKHAQEQNCTSLVRFQIRILRRRAPLRN